MSDLNDKRQKLEDLVVAVQKENSHDAFGEIYDLMVDAVYRYVFYRVGDEEAEDIVEMTFVKVWENVNKYKMRKNSSFVSWVFRIAHNLMVDYYRKREKLVTEQLTDFVADQKREHNPVGMTVQAFNQAKVAKAMAELSEVYNEVITLKYFSGLSNLQIAEVMGKSEGSVRVLQFRALKELKKQLGKLGMEEH